MKPFIKIGIALSILSCFPACEKTIENKPPEQKPEYVDNLSPDCSIGNSTEHTISIVQRPACGQFPDSLVLLAHTSYRFNKSGHRPGLDFFNNSNQEFDTRIVYFDGRYMINFADINSARTRKFFNYEIYSKSDDNRAFFSFVEADFIYAERNGKDLGEPKQTP